MLSALRSVGAARSILGQQASKALAAGAQVHTSKADSAPVPSYLADAPGLAPGIKDGYSPMGHKILNREEKMAVWKYVNSVYFGPERDMKNFPNPSIGESPPTRLGMIPESWFDAMYPKTGVTGPYVFLGGFSLWMLAKEHMVVDHYFWEFPCFWGAVYFLNCHPAVGPKMKEWFTREVEKTKFLEYDRPLGRLRASAEKDVSSLQRLIEETETHTYIAQAKEEGVGLQLEASYRARLQNAFTEVKKRLDYEAEKAAVKRRFEQEHMVNWIVSSVTKSITPQQEKESIKSCLNALKDLAAKQNVAAA